MQAHSTKTFFSSAIFFILLATPLCCFSQTWEDDETSLLLKLSKKKTNTSRGEIFFTLSQYYLSKSDVPGRGFDSALYFVGKGLYACKVLNPVIGENVIRSLTEISNSRNIEINHALGLLRSQQDSTLFRLLLLTSKYYLFKKERSRSDIDSSFLLLDQAGKIAANTLSEKWRNESIHAWAVFYFRTGDIQKGKKLFRELIDKISKPGNERAEANYWHEFAKVIPSRDTIPLTKLYCIERALDIYKTIGDEKNELGILADIADMHMLNGRFVLAETQLTNLLKRYPATDHARTYWIYNLLAVTNSRKGDFTKGVFYGLKAIESMEASKNYKQAKTLYSNQAHMYTELGQPQKSVEWYWKLFEDRKFTDESNMYIFRDAGLLARELIKLNKENEALAFMLDIEAKNKPSNEYAAASLLASLAYCYHAMNRNQQAEKFYLKLINLTGQLQKDNEITTGINYEIGQYLMDKRLHREAADYLHKALNAPAGINSLSVIKDIYMMLYKSDSAMGNYLLAIQHLRKHNLMNDSIFNVNKSRQIEELQVKYETDQKEKDIELLAKKNELQNITLAQTTRTKNISLWVAALLLIIGGLIFNRYIIKQRSNRVLEAHQMELDQKNIFLETLNAQQEKLIKEKEWLVREVHHRVKNNLQLVISLLNTQSAYLDDKAAVLAVKDSLRRMQAMSLIHQKLYQSENVSAIAMPGYVNDLVNYLFDSFDTAKRIVLKQNIAPLDLDASLAIPLGLIINESIVNAIKYAFPNGQSGVLSINLGYAEADYLVLKISDNGVGLPVGFDIMGNNSLGLDLMKGLAKQLNGSFTIESNRGLHITVKFPALQNNFSDNTAQIFE